MRFSSLFPALYRLMSPASAELSLKSLTGENYQDGKERTKMENRDSDAPRGGKAVKYHEWKIKSIKWTWTTLRRIVCPCEKEAVCVCVCVCCATQWKQANALSLKTRRLWNQLSSSLPFCFFLSLFHSGLSACLVRAALQGAVVPERFLSVLNPSISLCPGKKYIRMKLKRPTGAKACEKKMSFSPAFCGN